MFAEGKDNYLFTLKPNLFLTFFKSHQRFFLYLFIQNVAINAGAKVTIFFLFPNLF